MTEILSPGEKLKKLRKKLGLRQYDITDGKITRNLISAIENGKANLTMNTAVIIANKINKLCNDREIDFYVSIDYLLESEIEQARKAARDFIDKLHKYMSDSNLDIDMEIDNINSFLLEWDLPEEKAELYELIGEIYFSYNDYLNSYKYYNSSLENMLRIEKTNNISRLFYKLAKCCIYLKEYNQSIYFNKRAISFLKTKDKSSTNLITKSKYNLALAYVNLDKFNVALEILDPLSDEITEYDSIEYIYTLLLKGNCYLELKLFNKALDEYNICVDLCKKNNNSYALSLTYANIAALYNCMSDYDKANEYDILAFEIRKKQNSQEMFNTLVKIIRRYRILNNYTAAEKYLSFALENEKLIKSKELLLNLYIEINRLYITQGFINKIYGFAYQVENEFSEEVKLDYSILNSLEIFYLDAIDFFIDKDIHFSKRLLENLKRGKLRNEKN